MTLLMHHHWFRVRLDFCVPESLLCYTASPPHCFTTFRFACQNASQCSTSSFTQRPFWTASSILDDPPPDLSLISAQICPSPPFIESLHYSAIAAAAEYRVSIQWPPHLTMMLTELLDQLRPGSAQGLLAGRWGSFDVIRTTDTLSPFGSSTVLSSVPPPL